MNLRDLLGMLRRQQDAERFPRQGDVLLSLTPAVTAESSANRRPVALLTRCAIVVFPVPGGPNRISDTTLESPSTSRRSGDRVASRCS